MAVNPFFLHGSSSEQRLVQELVNEQLRMYGIEVIYIPRKFVRKQTIIREVTTSKFDDNFVIEAYVNSYDGYSGQGDLLTKFGVNLKDELSIVISKERFEDFITPFLETLDEDEIILSSRPREGDIIYFPLGNRIFEVKFVEHEQPFYQLGKLYVYELKCELFEYEDETINTTIDQIDESFENYGYTTSLKLISFGQQATGVAYTTTGYVRKIILNNDGYDYTSTPTVSISTSPSGNNATAVAITTCVANICSVKEILLTNAGSGYTTTPSITISGGGGVGASATCIFVKDYVGISSVGVATTGAGYATTPTIQFSAPSIGIAVTAIARVSISTDGEVTGFLFSDAGVGYTTSSGIAVTISAPPLITGIGTFIFNEVVTGSVSGASGRVKSWDKDTNILKIGTTDKSFEPGDIIVGSASSATYLVDSTSSAKFEDKYDDNDNIEAEADLIIDFSESNPFGNY